MGEIENPLPEVDQEEHPLRILSQENLTVVSTFTGTHFKIKVSFLSCKLNLVVLVGNTKNGNFCLTWHLACVNSMREK